MACVPDDSEGVLLLVAAASAVGAVAVEAQVRVGLLFITVPAVAVAEAVATLLAGPFVVDLGRAAAVRAGVRLGLVLGDHVAPARVHAALLARLLFWLTL